MEQRSPEWFAARLGKVTASRVADVMAKTKTGYGASRGNYMAELICDRLTGTQAERFTNAAMQWGTDNEPAAKSAYTFVCDAVVSDEAFVNHPNIFNFGASPDGLVDDDGLLEIKCPNTATHIETLLSGTCEGKYITQMQAQMACTGRKWCDFVSYDPRMPVDMQLFIKRVNRDDIFIAKMEDEIVNFLQEVHEKINALNAQYASKAA